MDSALVLDELDLQNLLSEELDYNLDFLGLNQSWSNYSGIGPLVPHLFHEVVEG